MATAQDNATLAQMGYNLFTCNNLASSHRRARPASTLSNAFHMLDKELGCMMLPSSF